jgi:hypothetical protein
MGPLLASIVSLTILLCLLVIFSSHTLGSSAELESSTDVSQNENPKVFTQPGAEADGPKEFDLLRTLQNWPKIASYVAMQMPTGRCRDQTVELGEDILTRMRAAQVDRASNDIVRPALCKTDRECVAAITRTIKDMIAETPLVRGLANKYLGDRKLAVVNLEQEVVAHYDSICSSVLVRSDL